MNEIVSLFSSTVQLLSWGVAEGTINLQCHEYPDSKCSIKSKMTTDNKWGDT